MSISPFAHLQEWKILLEDQTCPLVVTHYNMLQSSAARICCYNVTFFLLNNAKTEVICLFELLKNQIQAHFPNSDIILQERELM